MEVNCDAVTFSLARARLVLNLICLDCVAPAWESLARYDVCSSKKPVLAFLFFFRNNWIKYVDDWPNDRQTDRPTDQLNTTSFSIRCWWLVLCVYVFLVEAHWVSGVLSIAAVALLELVLFSVDLHYCWKNADHSVIQTEWFRTLFHESCVYHKTLWTICRLHDLSIRNSSKTRYSYDSNSTICWWLGNFQKFC